MRLVDLAPFFCAEDGREGMGLAFRCPHCEDFLYVPFKNPLSGGAGKPNPNGCMWEREGDTFETLTLSPSVDSKEHWHGWIRNGEVTNA